jgi:general stress protein YciG
MDEPKKSKRGFASMDPEKRREIASKGGKSVPPERRSFSQSAELAAKAGRKGGQSVDPAKRSFSRDHTLASQAGAKGGHSSHGGGKGSKKLSEQP